MATPETTSYFYDLVGNLDLQRQANGTIAKNVYDSLYHLDTLTQYAPDATPNDLADNPKIADFDYTVRADGKRTAVTERIWKDGPTQSPLVNQFGWDYDEIGRLTQEILDSTDNSLDYTTSYKFDLAGNRLEKKVDQGSNNTIDQFFAYAYDANDRLLTESLDNGMDAIIDQITTYGWGASNLGTQQASKIVHDQATNLDTSRVTWREVDVGCGKMSFVLLLVRLPKLCGRQIVDPLQPLEGAEHFGVALGDVVEPKLPERHVPERGQVGHLGAAHHQGLQRQVLQYGQVGDR